MEGLSGRVETVGSGDTAIVDSAHRLVALVAWQLHLVIFDDILLNDRVAVLALELRLGQSMLIEVALGDETIVAGDVSGHLGGAHGQVVGRVALLSRVRGKLVTGVASVWTIRQVVFSGEVRTAGSVGLTGQAPHRGSRLGGLLLKGALDLGLVGRSPVRGRAAHDLLAGALEASVLASRSFVLSTLGVAKELGLVGQVVVN